MTSRESGRLPRWFYFVLGIAAVGVGLYVFSRPFSSLSLLVILIAVGLIVTGASRLIGAEDNTTGLTRVVGALWITGGIAVLAWPDITVRTVVWVLAGWLVVDGLVDVIAGFRQGTDDRAASVLKGAASVVFGALAILWPDITILVIALVFAAKLVMFGVSRIISGFRGGPKAEDDESPGRLRRWARVGGAALALLAALGLVALSSRLRSGEPIVDEFYSVPTDLPAEPGVLLATEPYENGVPETARGWRILYTTTRDEGFPAVGSGILVVPTDAAGGPIPVIAWAHGTTGVNETCAPSILEAGVGAGAFYATDQVIEEGWALVATDYVGLGTDGPHPYLIGQVEARSVLDAVRAAKQVEEVSLDEETIVWGHSQGGHAALWTGVITPDYAPDVNVAGVAALAPASDLVTLVPILRDAVGGNIFAGFAVSAFAEHYPEVVLDDYVTPGGQVILAGMVERCLGEPAVFASILSSLVVEWSMFSHGPASGPIHQRFVENTPPPTIDAPLMLAQGGADGLILPSMQDGYVESLCAAGQAVDYRVYEGLGHVPLVAADSPLIPELIEWTRARMDGEDALSTCPGA